MLSTPLLLLVGFLLVVGIALIAVGHHFRRQRADREMQIQRQIQRWQRENPIEILGGRLSDLRQSDGARSFVLMFWNNSGLDSTGVTVRLVEVGAGLELKPLQPVHSTRPMPLKLLPFSKLNDFREGRQSRPLARLDLAAYERGEVEVAAISPVKETLHIEHETSAAQFSLHCDNYEFVLELSIAKFTQRFSIGLTRLTGDGGRWVASHPKFARKLDA